MNIDLEFVQARYEELCDMEEITEDELLEVEELYAVLYPDAVEQEW